MARASRLIAVTVACALFALACTDSDDEPTVAEDIDAVFTEAPCPVSLPESAAGVHCGTVAVPARYDDPSGTTIDVAIAVFPASDVDGDGVPIVMLGGGPGEHMIRPMLSALAAGNDALDVTALHTAQDLIVIDQRGVGTSRPALECPEFVESLGKRIRDTEPGTASSPDLVHDAALEGYQACHDRLVGDGVDVAAFDTPGNARDLEMIRRALGYEQINLFGTSYGARLALYATHLFPDTIAAAVLSSPIPMQANFVDDAGQSFQQAFDALAEACAGEADCDRDYPDLRMALERTLAALDDEPVHVGAATIDARTVATTLQLLFYAPDGPSLVPYVVTAIDRGDYHALIGRTPQTRVQAGAQASLGMQMSVLCAEEAVDAQPSDIDPEPGMLGSYIRDTSTTVGPLLWDICEIWDVDPEADEVFIDADPEQPLLVVTGQFDHITPPVYGRDVADRADQASYLEIPWVGHSPVLAAGDCGIALVATYLADPAADLDTQCATEVVNFATPEEAAELIRNARS